MENILPNSDPEQKERERSSQVIIFTDLDGTLLDHATYSYEAASDALARIKETRTPLVPISSKNFTEIADLEQEMGIWKRDPFITENGHGIFIPQGYFSFPITDVLPDVQVREYAGFDVIEYGMAFEQAKEILQEIKAETGLPMVLQSELTPEQFAEETGLSVAAAKRALTRMYLEGFRYDLPKEEQADARARVREAIEKRGYGMTQGGRYDWMLGRTSKAHAASELITLYERAYGTVTTVGVGDAPNDDFLTVCDRGYLVKNPKKVVDIAWENVEQVDEEGPEGWNTIILHELAATNEHLRK